MTGMVLSQQILMVAGLVAAVAVIIGGIVKVYRLAHRIDAALGVDQEGRTLAARMGRVEHQLWPNGGDSMADQIIANGKQIADVDRKVVAVAAEVRVVRDMLAALIESRVN